MHFWRALFLLPLILLAAACAPNSRLPDTSLPRAAPSHLHWLQKQSLLHQAPELIAQVSQSGRVWLQASGGGKTDILLGAAPNWLLAATADLSRPIFSALSREAATLPALGINGIYLGQTGERPDIWLRGEASQKPLRPAAFEFDAAFGTEEDFEQLADAAEAAHVELGSTLIGAATGLGPDFALAARNSPGCVGLYAMLPAPRDADLPPARGEWDGQAISAAQIGKLADQEILPARIARDGAAWASAGGWAVSGAITGADGMARRWLYRYSDTPEQAVLAWQDPAGLAQKVFSAAVIRATGLQGQTLAGLSFEPLLGLEPGGNGASFSPGLEAINELARQIHRYGGWAIQADAAPLSVINAVLRGPCDFCRDDVTTALVMFGLLAADGRPVAQLYRDWIAQNAPVCRLARGLEAADGIEARILLDNPQFSAQAARLAAAGAQITPQAVAAHLKTATYDTIRRFLLLWRLGMPGLVFTPAPAGDDAWLANTLRARKSSGLAAGKALQVIRGNGGGFGLLSHASGGTFWLLACNFGVNPDQIVLKLPRAAASALDAATGAPIGQLNGADFRIALDGRAAVNVVFQ